MANYAFTTGKDLPTVKDGHTFEMCNFTQAVPNTEIFKGVTSLTFKKCNLVNCKIPADAVKINSLNIQKEFCSNEHPDWIEKGLPDCGSETCKHYQKTVTDKTYNVKTGVLEMSEDIKEYNDLMVK